MKFDKTLFISVILLSLFGLLMIYSSSSIWAEYKFNDSLHYLKYQSFFFILGLMLMIFISKIDYRLYYKYSNKILLISFILLILVLIPGIGSIRNGSRSWFGIGPLGIQPSEAAKISLIIFTSKYLSLNEKYIKYFFKGVVPILIITCLFFGLIMLQPDLGTGLILFLSIISILYIAGVSMNFFVFGGILGIIGVVFLIIIAPYRMDRITSFIKFLSGFQQVMTSIPNTKMIILNGYENITISQYGNIKIYNNGFSKVMIALRNNILKYRSLKSDEKFVVLVLNYNELNRKLKEKSKNESSEDIFSISDLINLSRNSNNFRFIIYDLSSNSDDLKNGDLIDYFDGLSGIWIGNNFDGQMVFESKNGMDFGTIGDDVLISIEDGHASDIKYVR